MTWWIRAYLLFAAIQGLGIGLTGLLVPSEMQYSAQIESAERAIRRVALCRRWPRRGVGRVPRPNQE